MRVLLLRGIACVLVTTTALLTTAVDLVAEVFRSRTIVAARDSDKPQ